MSDSELERIFLPFEQADAGTTQRFGGTGLGTTISLELARRMGGDLSAQSVVGHGSTFAFRVPAPPVLAAAEVEALPVAPPAAALQQVVLLVEDNAVNARIATLLLRSLGAEVLHAPDGREALDLAEQADVVLMDIRMPVMDGLESTRLLRARGYHRPIIALTANVMPEDQARYLSSGFDEVLGKPYEVEQLARVLREVGGGRADRRPRGGDCTLAPGIP